MYKQTYKFVATALLSAMFLGGCASSKAPDSTEAYIGASNGDRQLHLIGSFNWWEVDEQYAFADLGSDRYSTQVELIADGQPYDFIIADAKWSPGYTCGYLDKDSDHSLTLNKPAKADCTARTNNFQFQPSENGLYKVEIDFSKRTPRVVIRD